VKYKQKGVDGEVIVDAFKAESKDQPQFIQDYFKSGKVPKGFYAVTQLTEGKPGWMQVAVYNPAPFEAEYDCLTPEAPSRKPLRE